MRVLVVEDSFTQAQLHQMNLVKRGFEVDWVTNLSEVIDRLQQTGIDVVLLDLSLPDSVGLDTFYKVNNFAENIPIVVMTSLDDQDLAIEALSNGAQDYLIKGQTSDDMLVRCLRHAIERGRVERQLRDSERRNRMILENSYDAFIAFDATGTIAAWNRQAENSFGWWRHEIIGRRLADTLIPERFLRLHLKDMQRLKNTGSGAILNRRAELILLHKDGTEIPVEIGLFRVGYGTYTEFCAFIRDITERKAIERRSRQINEELERAVEERTAELVRSNAELQQFAKIASHDLQEPLRTIEGYTQLLSTRYKGKLDKDGDEFIDYIMDGTRRMLKLIQDVLAHSAIGTSDVKMITFVDCQSVVREAVANLKASIEESHAKVDIGHLPVVMANRQELVQLFQNLIGNAIKYRGDARPEITIACEENVHDWVFSVKDNGIGIDPQYKDKVFDMFARLHGKNAYAGTGIGLAICKKIVETHEGRIWVESEPGKGSIFLFTLLRLRSAEMGKGEVA